ncbi:hypothetical protein [Myxococcus sp. CA040A]|uniref:hypothetical protein n=1 Tax=Myxococcus sp. CA040A TaxID=2741738 RepID=UPI00157AC91E|nr:hypothetical protein [Myxococcus sp. CA040A]NTX07051.1 hypothetical protein [Myxococcus sp. CA040A]
MSEKKITAPGASPGQMSPHPGDDADAIRAKATAVLGELSRAAKEAAASNTKLTRDSVHDVAKGFDLGVPDDVWRWSGLLEAETDRGTALVGAAFLEEKLGSLLGAFIIDDAKLEKALLEGTAPLGTFSARTKACEALGLLRHDTCRLIDRVRNIRNKFAHVSKDLTFESLEIRDSALSLGEGIPQATTPRVAFICATMLLAGELDRATLAARAARRVRPSAPSTLSPAGLIIQEVVGQFLEWASDGDSEPPEGGNT